MGILKRVFMFFSLNKLVEGRKRNYSGKKRSFEGLAVCLETSKVAKVIEINARACFDLSITRILINSTGW